ncbi:MAG: hypothetical protein V3T70_04830, partial [Phycisphaerae bacterium]
MASVMNDRAARITFVLGLVPLTGAVFILTGEFIDIARLKIDQFQAASMISSLLVCAANVIIWRRYIRWNALRAASTGALTLLVIGQVLLWQPLWSGLGCGVGEVMRFGQSVSVLGLWCVGCCLTWWTMRMGSTDRPPDRNAAHHRRMTSETVRLALWLGMVPLLFGLFFMIGVTIGRWTDLHDPAVGIIAFEVVILIAILVWWGLWRLHSAHTKRHLALTFLLGFAAIISPLYVFPAFGVFPRR